MCASGRYCCDNSTYACASLSSCAGNRHGLLCGDCAFGYVENIGSSRCGPVSKCAQDRKVVWVIVIAALLLVGGVHLTVVSGVGLTSTKAPSGRLKLLIYYAQVGVWWDARSLCTVCTHGNGVEGAAEKCTVGCSGAVAVASAFTTIVCQGGLLQATSCSCELAESSAQEPCRCLDLFACLKDVCHCRC